MLVEGAKGCFTGTDVILWLPSVSYLTLKIMGKIGWYLTTMKLKKVQTVSIFLEMHFNQILDNNFSE